MMNNNKRKYVICPQCGRKLHNGAPAVQRKGCIGYFCNERCLCLFHCYTKNVIVNDNLLEEDETEREE